MIFILVLGESESCWIWIPSKRCWNSTAVCRSTVSQTPVGSWTNIRTISKTRGVHLHRRSKLWNKASLTGTVKYHPDVGTSTSTSPPSVSSVIKFTLRYRVSTPLLRVHGVSHKLKITKCGLICEMHYPSPSHLRMTYYCGIPIMTLS